MIHEGMGNKMMVWMQEGSVPKARKTAVTMVGWSFGSNENGREMEAMGMGVCEMEAMGMGVCEMEAMGMGVCEMEAMGMGVCDMEAMGMGACDMQRKATDREEERRDEVNGVGHIMMLTASIPEWRHIGQMGSGSAVKGCTATEVSVKPCSHWCNRDRIPSIGAKIDRSFRWRYYLRSVHTVSMQLERWPKTHGKACRVSAPSVTKLH